LRKKRKTRRLAATRRRSRKLCSNLIEMPRNRARTPLPPIRASANMPPVGASNALRANLGTRPLLQPGTKEYSEELVRQGVANRHMMLNSAARSRSHFETNRELGIDPLKPISTYYKPQTPKEIKEEKEPELVEVPPPTLTAAANALTYFGRLAITKKRLERLGKTLPPYEPPTPPAPYMAPRSSSPVVTSRKMLHYTPPAVTNVAPTRLNQLPEGRYTPPETGESTFRWICNKISCGLFSSRRKRKGKGGRRTIRKRRQSRRSR